MASISQLKLPDNTVYNIKGSIHSVIGTQTSSTGSWTGNLTSVDSLYDGLTIAYYLPYAGSSNATLNLTLKDNVTTGAIDCYLTNNMRVTTQYKEGSVVCLTYFSAGSISADGTPTTSARWIAQMGYEMIILSYGSSTWNDFITAYNTNSLVYCRASSNSNPASGNQTRMAFMAYVNSNPPTEVEFQYYRSVSSHSATQQGDQVYIYKLNKSTGWSVTVREAKIKIAAGQGLTQSFASNTLTLSAETYESKTAASGGTDLSLVTTGEKYTWDNKTDNTGTVTSIATGVGLTGGSITTSGTIKANLRSETALTNDSVAATEMANRVYPIAQDNSGYLAVNVPWTDNNDDTKNTAGSTDSSDKLFLIGATSQAANPQTYSQDTAYVGTDGHLYSNSKQTVNLSDTQALTNKTYNGYTLAAACAKTVDASISSTTSTNLPTSAAVADYIDTAIDDAIVIGSTQPSGSNTKIWIKI